MEFYKLPFMVKGNIISDLLRLNLQKIGFWPLFAIVIGGQVGSGIFMLPASLAPYGIFGILGLLFAAVGALSLAITFAMLCYRYPRTGGPHTYVQIAFGKNAAFFTGWTYWLVSWVSSSAVVIAAMGYFIPILGEYPKEVYITLEILVLLLITLINIKGVSSAGKFEVMMAILKFTPLIIIPTASLLYFDYHNLSLDSDLQQLNISELLSKVTLMTLWGFIGLESATTPASAVFNPSRNIPRAIIAGTTFVAIVYLINSIGIMGIIPGESLKNSSAAYVEATQYVFGGKWHMVISLIATIVCLSALNAWVLASGQIALGLSEDGLMPKIFAKKNKHNAPVYSLLISGLGVIPLLFLTKAETFTQQITSIIDFSVITFLFVYLICSVSFLYIQIKEKNFYSIKSMIPLFAMLFCIWVIINTEMKVIFTASMFIASGIPLYIYWYREINQ